MTTAKYVLTPYLIFVMLLIFQNSTLVYGQTKLSSGNIENGLLPPILVKGEAINTYNIINRMKYHNIPGVSIAVIKDGGLLWTKGYGKLNATKDDMVNTETLFQAASISKAFTALGVLKLVEQGKLDLDTNANAYLKDWQIQNNEFTKTEKVTLRRIMSHTAGLNVHGFDGYAQSDNFPSTIEVLNGAGNSQSVAVERIPGTEWNYSGGGYVILQKVIEDVTGRKFGEFMDTEILKPLKMTNSTFEQPLNGKNYKNIAIGHNNNGKPIAGGWHNYPEQGAGGLWTTPSELAKYCIDIQQILAGKQNGLLSKETIDLMLKEGLANWGLGVFVDGSGNSLHFGHEGSNYGYNSDFIAFPNKKEGVIIMTNGNTTTLVNEILRSTSKHYNWKTHNQRVIEVKEFSEDELKKFIGHYLWSDRPNSNWTVEVVLENRKLHFVAADFPTSILTPYAISKFIDLESSVEVEFNISQSNKVIGLTWRGRFNFEKLE